MTLSAFMPNAVVLLNSQIGMKLSMRFKPCLIPTSWVVKFSFERYCPPYLSVQTLSGRIENRNLASGAEIVVATAVDLMPEDMVDIREGATKVEEEVTKIPPVVRFTLEMFAFYIAC